MITAYFMQFLRCYTQQICGVCVQPHYGRWWRPPTIGHSRRPRSAATASAFRPPADGPYSCARHPPAANEWDGRGQRGRWNGRWWCCMMMRPFTPPRAAATASSRRTTGPVHGHGSPRQPAAGIRDGRGLGGGRNERHAQT